MKTIAAQSDPTTPRHGRRGETPPGKWLVFASAAIGVFMSTLDSSIVNIALPVIMADFQVPLEVIEWVPMVYLLTVSSLLLTFGRLSDIYGRREVFCAGFTVFVLGSLLCGASVSAGMLIAARSFQGAGAAMIMACSPALVADAFPVSERGRSLGMIGTVVAAGLTTGPALGGFILHRFDWSAIFYINIPIGVVATVVAFFVLRGVGAPRRRESLDVAGALLLVLCLVSLLVWITRLQDWGLASLNGWLFPVLFGVSVGSLVRVEMRSPYPIFDPDLLGVRLFVWPLISAVLLFMSLFTVIFLMPFYLVHPLGFSMDKVGVTMMIPFAFLFFLSPMAGSLSDRIGSRLLCTLGMGGLAVSLFLLSRLPAAATVADIAWRLALTGVAVSIFISPNSAAALNAVEPRRRGIASGSLATARNLGMVVGVAVAGLIFNYRFRALSGGEGLKTYQPAMEPFFMEAFRWAMTAGAAVAALGVVAAYFRGSPPAAPDDVAPGRDT